MEKQAVLLGYYQAASTELLRRIELQLKLAELYGILMVGVYSGVLVSGRYLLLLLVPPLCGIALLWWTDRQGMVGLLRRFILEQIEPQIERAQGAASDDLVVGWQTYFTQHYHRTSRQVHMLIVAIGFGLPALPALAVIAGCLNPDILARFESTPLHSDMRLLSLHPYGPGVAWISISIASATFLVSLGLARIQRRQKSS